MGDENGETCSSAMHNRGCFDHDTNCKSVAAVLETRKRINHLTNEEDSRFLIGEMGWVSAPTVGLSESIESCSDFSSPKMLWKYYSNFLKWDLSLPENLSPPEHD